MKIAIIIARVLMGVMFLWASAAYFLNWVPEDYVPPKDVATYMTGISTVHLMDIVKTIELLCAICYLAGRYVALANVVLLPITFNIVLLHALIDPGTVAMAVAILVVHVFLLYAYRNHYTGVFAAKRIE
ncbi:DoxX family protein [Flavobacterium longum]|uniref:DoxX family protein n=1 Tax=Flavobacterium longum TaxID=1299340 RepID=UPI0039E776C4